MIREPDPIGEKYNSWTVLERGQDRYDHGRYYLCQCSCGRIKEVSFVSLKNGKSKGCLKCARGTRSSIREIRLHHYGLTEAELDSLILKQDGRCSICLREAPLVIDHDHSTNDIRGLICANCNVGLGMFNDSPERLERALQYLNQPDTILGKVLPRKPHKKVKTVLR